DADRARAVRSMPDSAEGIFCCDVMLALDMLESRNYQLIVADPPYNIGFDFGNESDRQSEEEYVLWSEQWVRNVHKVAAANASLYVCTDWNHSGFFQRMIESAGWHILNRVTWKRDKGRGANRNWKQNMEDIWFAVRDKRNYTFNIEDVKIMKKVKAPYREN